MKILKLTFQNINSLYGKWVIDFQDPAYTSNGLFVLTGNTGSGKSSVLDAMMLALYAETPRLGNITIKNNEILSRGTNCCSSEIEFEAGGKKYRVSWSYKKTGKNTSAPKHEISDLETGELITVKKGETREEVEKITGLTSSQFIKTVLLAQGDFGKFLDSKEGDKTELFKKITGTEIYADISKAVYEKNHSEKKNLDEIQGKLADLKILTPQEVDDLNKKIKDLNLSKEKNKTELDETKEMITWWKTFNDLKEKFEKIQDETRKNDEALKNFESDRKRLEVAEHAAKLNGDYLVLVTNEKRLAEDQGRLEECSKKIPELEEKYKEKQENFKKSRSELDNLRNKEKEEKPTILKVRALDRDIANLQEQLNSNSSKITEEKKNIQQQEEEIKNIDQTISTLNEECKNIKRYLTDHSQDQNLLEEYSALESEFYQLKDLEKELRKYETVLQDAEDKCSQAARRKDEAGRKLSEAKDKFDSAEKDLNKLNEERDSILNGKTRSDYEKQRDALYTEREFHKVVQSLEKHRGNLIDGEPCPLCGSEVHPYAMGNIPTPTETDEKIKRITGTLEKIDKAEENCRNGEVAVQNAKTQRDQFQSDQKLAEQDLQSKIQKVSECKKENEKKKSDFQEKKDSFIQKVTPYCAAETEYNDDVINCLKARLNQWKVKTDDQKKKEEEINTCRGERNICTTKIDEYKKNLADANESKRRIESELNRKNGERHELYGEKDPEKEEKQIQDAIDKANKKMIKLNELHEEANGILRNTETVIKGLSESIQRQTGELSQLSSDFKVKLDDNKFESREDFERSRLADEEMEKLSKQRHTLDDEKSSLSGRFKEIERSFNEQNSKKKTDKNQNELESIKDDLESRIAGIEDELTRHKVDQERNNENQKMAEDLEKEHGKQKGISERWGALNELIGSADGNKYSNFVHCLTLDRVIEFANKELSKISNRYQLKRKQDESKNFLDIDVIDYEQAGEIRTTKNLSGGERFMVSLALALGISKLAGKNVRVDSLFLDEGFGTLDEHSLDKAISALESLQQDGKLIGIITHVPQLQGDESRIQTQIHVIPKSKGRSYLEGPGVTHLNEQEEVLK